MTCKIPSNRVSVSVGSLIADIEKAHAEDVKRYERDVKRQERDEAAWRRKMAKALRDGAKRVESGALDDEARSKGTLYFLRDDVLVELPGFPTPPSEPRDPEKVLAQLRSATKDTISLSAAEYAAYLGRC